MTSDGRVHPQEETELLRRFLALKPHDDIVIERERDDIPANARLLRAYFTGHGMEWVRMPVDNFPRTPRPGSEIGGRPIGAYGAQTFRFDEDGRAMADFYRYGDVMLVSRKALACLDRFDPEGFQHVPADVEGLPAGSYFLIMPNRALDVIDLPRTTVRLRNYLLATDPAVGEIFSRTARFPKGYTVRDDVPASAHLVLNTYNPDILMSVDVIDCLTRCGVAGIEGGAHRRLSGEERPLAMAPNSGGLNVRRLWPGGDPV